MNKSLQKIGEKYNSDRSKNKIGLKQTYNEYYETVFNNRKIDTILEIGTYYGNGLLTFRDYFPNAFLIGIDKSLKCFNHKINNCHVYECDQTNEELLKSILQKYSNLDLVIDDASHEIKKSIISFNTIFPYLSNGGIYIIEDLQCFNSLNNLNVKNEFKYDNDIVVNYTKDDFSELINFIKDLSNQTLNGHFYHEIKITNNSLIIIKNELPMKSKYQDYVCMRPFSEAQIMSNGEVLGCCPAWVNHYKLGNIHKKSLKEIWNDKPAQEFRKSILDGSFRFCNEKSCPMLQSKTGEVFHKDNINSIFHREVIDDINNKRTILNHGPLHFQMCYDRSCNLSCPSCRSELIYATGKERDDIEILQSEVMKNIKTARRLTVTPSGDPFASITFRNFLINLKQEDAPNLNGITILTNGLLLKKYWYELSEYVRSKIDCISVSIDATEEEIYKKIRRGGDFKILQENLQFIKDVIKVRVFAVSTVIQKDNYHLLSDFITFAKKYGCNRLQYQIFEPDFRISEDVSYLNEWIDKAIQEKTHPSHIDFKKYVEEINLEHEDLFIDFGPLLNLKSGGDISQLETVLDEHKKMWDDNLKDIWFNGEVYYIDKRKIKKVHKDDVETDAVFLEKYKTYVYWNNETKEWLLMN